MKLDSQQFARPLTPPLSTLFELSPQPFEYFILVTILATCVSLALNTPYPNNDSDDTNKELNTDFQFMFSWGQVCC